MKIIDCDYEVGLHVETDEEVVSVDLLYPRSDGHPSIVEVGMEDVRSADNVRVTYDFERDGWIILQASRFSWDTDDEERDEGWQEVAFVQAWETASDWLGRRG